MQAITKKQLLELVNAEVDKLIKDDETLVISDVKQEGHIFVFYADDLLNDPKRIILAQEIIGKVEPLFRGKYILID